jgi:5-methylcytosine-specific restriction enzyme subunit McrC
LNKERQHITVFEHEVLRVDKGENRITENQLLELQRYYGNGISFFSLCNNGIQFNEHVGVIQVGNTLIEVLPKADKNDTGKSRWRDMLIGMLKAVGAFEIKSSSNSHLKVKPNTILDLYFEVFINEIEYLLHSGLVKQYRKKEGNLTVLKGSLQFKTQVQLNLTHQERFYVRYTTYDLNHKLHYILYKTLCLLKRINTRSDLHSRIGSLLLIFPEMPDIKVSESTFKKLSFTRKNKAYIKAIDIARILLLQYHPDIRKGTNNVLALMFDMNKLWEQFVYVSLRKHMKGGVVTAQTSKFFWKPSDGFRSRIKPDILVSLGQEGNIVLDTKWKSLNGFNPSPDDLRQLYVYHEYYHARKVALIYPGKFTQKRSGVFLDPKSGKGLDKECSVISISVEPVIKQWQLSIYNEFEKWWKEAKDSNP